MEAQAFWVPPPLASELFQQKLDHAQHAVGRTARSPKNHQSHDDIHVNYGEGQTVAEAIVNRGERMSCLLQRCVHGEHHRSALQEKEIYPQARPHTFCHSIFSGDGQHANPEKICTTIDMPTLDGPAAVRRFLGIA